MKRRLFSILLTLALCLGLMPLGAVPVHAATEVDSGTCGANVTWTLDDEGLLTISGTGEMEGGAFAGNYGSHHAEIKSAVFGSGVTNVGSSAFYRRKKIGSTGYEDVIFSNLTNVQLSDTIKSIGANAFGKTTIDSITIPNSVTVLDNQAFEESGFTNLVLPDSVVSIGYRAFASAKRLEEVTLPDTLTNLSASVFAGCTALETIHFNGVIKSIDDSAFYGCTALPSLKLAVDGKDASIGNSVFYNVGSNVVTIYGIPGGTVESGASAKNYTFVTAQNTFKFDANGGAGSMDDLPVTFDSADKGNFPANNFTNGNKTFTGWNTKEDGSGIPVEDKTAVRILGVNGDITLYAQWEDAPVVPYDLYIAGTQVTSANAADLSVIDGVTGTISYTDHNKMLVMDNVTIANSVSGETGYGIQYTGTGTFSIYASGINSVKVTGNQTQSSAGIAIGDPYNYIFPQPKANLNIQLLEDTVLSVSGGPVVGDIYNSSYGIINAYSGDISVNGTGTLNAEGGSAEYYSYGISCPNNLYKTGTGTLNAKGADSALYSYGMYVSANAIITGGKLNAIGGATTGDDAASCGIGGDTSSSNTITIANGVELLAKGNTVALHKAPTLDSGVTAGGSANYDGSEAVKYAAADNNSYKWFKTPFVPEYTVTVTSDGNGTASASINEGETDTEVTLTATPNGGYQFKEWQVVSGGVTVTENKFTIGTADVEVKAIFEEIPTEPTQVAMPVLPASKSFTDSMTVTITCETEGAEIYYATGGAITLYEGAFNITETTTVEAYATKDGLDESEHTTATYTKTDPTPSTGGGGTTTYPVKPASVENGNVTVAPRNAAEKAKVTITVTPDEGYELDELTVKDKDGNEIEVKDNGDGTYTFTMPASAIEIEATFKPDEGGAADEFPFVDVPENSYFRKPVEWAVEKGITNGVSEDKYGPEMSCTRAQVVTFLWITCGSEDAGIETGFDDVDVSAYYDKAVAWAVEKGITAGTSETEFSPDMTITRAQFVTMLWAAKGKPESAGEMPFLDVPSDAYYAKAVAWAYANDITAGKSADSFAPEDPCTRGQIMTFLYNAYAE